MMLTLLIGQAVLLLLMSGLWVSLWQLRKELEHARTHTQSERAEVLDFVREKIQQRLNDFKNGSGRDRLRERLSQRVAEATRSGRSVGAQGADERTTGV